MKTPAWLKPKTRCSWPDWLWHHCTRSIVMLIRKLGWNWCRLRRRLMDNTRKSLTCVGRAEAAWIIDAGSSNGRTRGFGPRSKGSKPFPQPFFDVKTENCLRGSHDCQIVQWQGRGLWTRGWRFESTFGSLFTGLPPQNIRKRTRRHSSVGRASAL